MTRIDPKTAAQRVRLKFGAALKAARIAAGMSQSDLLGHDQSFISKAERGEANLTLETMARLAAAVGRDIGDMLAETFANRS